MDNLEIWLRQYRELSGEIESWLSDYGTLSGRILDRREPDEDLLLEADELLTVAASLLKQIADDRPD